MLYVEVKSKYVLHWKKIRTNISRVVCLPSEEWGGWEARQASRQLEHSCRRRRRRRRWSTAGRPRLQGWRQQQLAAGAPGH